VSSGNIFPHTFAIENNVRGLSEDIDSVHNVLTSRADGKSDVEWHRGGGKCTRRGEEGEGGRNGWLSHGGRALIKRLNGWLQRVIGVSRLDLEADYRPDPQRP